MFKLKKIKLQRGIALLEILIAVAILVVLFSGAAVLASRTFY
ncbi:type II secretion system protein [Vibrio aestuarianus]